MERYALLHQLQHQRQLARRMAPRQPLRAYVAQHRLLSAAIGPTPASAQFPTLEPDAARSRLSMQDRGAEPQVNANGQSSFIADEPELDQPAPYKNATEVEQPIRADEPRSEQAALRQESEPTAIVEQDNTQEPNRTSPKPETALAHPPDAARSQLSIPEAREASTNVQLVSKGHEIQHTAQQAHPRERGEKSDAPLARDGGQPQDFMAIGKSHPDGKKGHAQDELPGQQQIEAEALPLVSPSVVQDTTDLPEARSIALPEPLSMRQDAPDLLVGPPLARNTPGSITPVPEVDHTAQPASQRLHNQPRTRRARIEEQPSSVTSARPTQEAQANTKAPGQPEASRPTTKAEHKTEAQRTAESEAAALFASDTPNRSPQEWFALLTQGKQQSQPTSASQAERKQHTENTENSQRRALAHRNVETEASSVSDTTTSDTTASNTAIYDTTTSDATASDATASNTTVYDSTISNTTVPESTTMASTATRYGEWTRGPHATASAQFVPADQPATNRSSPSDPVARSGDARHHRGDQHGAPGGDARHHRGNQHGAPGGDAHHHRGDADMSAEPLSMHARQFLKPLVGFDPADARIHRGPAAARFVAAQRADAVTVGDDISLAAGHASDEPETLGLLAHELTHVARHHEPRTVPPILRTQNSPATTAQAAPGSTQNRTASDTSLASADEEDLAEQVERQVTLQAKGQTKASQTTPPTRATQTFLQPHAPQDGPQQLTEERQQEQSNGLRQPGGQEEGWGGLPAPWEPLPQWLAAPPLPQDGQDGFSLLPQVRPSLAAASAHGESGQGSTTSSSTTGGPGMKGGNMQAASAPQRAGQERSHDWTKEQGGGQEPPLEQHEPDPDLDGLARQVYAVLKRKLDVERRRMS